MLTFMTLALSLFMTANVNATKGQKIDKDENPSFVCKLEFLPEQTDTQNKKKEKTYVCSATLVSHNIVLTSAHCFTYREGDVARKAQPVAITCPGTTRIVGSFRYFYDKDYIREESKLVEFLASREARLDKNTEINDTADDKQQLELMKTTTSHDIAMVILPVEFTNIVAIEPVTDDDIERLKSTSVPERICRIAGYAGAAAKLRAGDIKIKDSKDLKRLGFSLDDAFRIRNEGSYKYVAIPYEAPVSYTAPGDSGGPIYCKVGVNWKVLGITSSLSSPDDFMPWMLWSIPTEKKLRELKEGLK